jgi:hypothetical protein
VGHSSGIRALCRWHFQPGGGPEYCRSCRDDGLPCARGEPGADGQFCPYREHPLISQQEHEAWDVLLACQGQLRLAPTGHVVGIDMDAALRIGAARCYLAVLSDCCRLPRLDWSRRCEAVESGTTGVTTRSKCPLTADLPPFQRTCVTSGSDPKPTLVRAIRRRSRADPCYTPAQRT